VRVHSLRWRAFELSVRGQFATARGTLTCRQGVIVQLTTDTGVVGLGEASPLPKGANQEVQSVHAVLTALTPALIGERLDALEEFSPVPGADVEVMAAVRCALDVAVCDALARATEIPVAALLTPDVTRLVRVNATIGAASAAGVSQAALQARAAGFGCVKLKVGMARSLEEECERVAAVREAVGSHMLLRLDANGAWEVDEAIRSIQALESDSLEFVEQPVKPGNLHAMRRVREAVRTPIAADEDVTNYEAACRILQGAAAQILVIKPMVLGGLRPARRIIELAQAAGVTTVVTTTIDSGVGTAAALHLAATLPHGSPACGLATANLLTTDLLVHPLPVRDGSMALPAVPGLGIELGKRILQ